MHELGLVLQVVKTIDEVAAQQGITEVSKIVLQVGEMTDVVPRFIEEAWLAAKDTTDYPNAEMVVEVIEGVSKCMDCGCEEKIRNIEFTCPHCGSKSLKIISGREFMIKEIEAK